MRLTLQILGIFILLLQIYAAPVYDAEEEDHELAGGYFEGDMEIDEDLIRNGIISRTRHWPSHDVYYKIDEVFDDAHVNHIKRGMRMIEAVSCIRFYPMTNESIDFVHIIGEPSGCHSKVGFQGKLQTMNLQVDPLDSGCFRLGTIMHEFLHTLGFHHQQSTPNRDDYVEIVEENISDGKEHNFRKYDADTVTDFGVEYDYGSVLHYSSTAFSKNGKKTIVPRSGENVEMGQRRQMSKADIDKLNLMYKCAIQN